MNITLNNGLIVPTGLKQTKLSLCSGLPVFEDSQQPLYTDAEIRDIIQDTARVVARDRFPAEIWIRKQINNGCNGFACAGALGRARVRRGLDPIVLSGDFVYSQISDNVDEGSGLGEGMRQLVTGGACRDELVQVGTYKKGQISKEAYEDAAKMKALECYVAKTKQGLYSGLAAGFVGVIAVMVEGRYSQLDQFGRVPPTDGPGNHAVCVDDIAVINNEINLDSPGSWGMSWGVRGRGYFTWERHLMTTSRYHEFFLIRSTTDDPSAVNPPSIVS